MTAAASYSGALAMNPGGGAGWFPGGPRPGFTVRHVPSIYRGATLSGLRGVKWKGPGGALGRIGKGALRVAAAAAAVTSTGVTSRRAGVRRPRRRG